MGNVGSEREVGDSGRGSAATALKVPIRSVKRYDVSSGAVPYRSGITRPELIQPLQVAEETAGQASTNVSNVSCFASRSSTILGAEQLLIPFNLTSTKTGACIKSMHSLMSDKFPTYLLNAQLLREIGEGTSNYYRARYNKNVHNQCAKCG